MSKILQVNRDFLLTIGDKGSKDAVESWLERNGFPKMIVTNQKIPAILYIDDRSWNFSGANFPSLNEVKSYKPWNRK